MDHGRRNVTAYQSASSAEERKRRRTGTVSTPSHPKSTGKDHQMDPDLLEVDSAESQSCEGKALEFRRARDIQRGPNWVPTYLKGYCCDCETTDGFSRTKEQCLNCRHHKCGTCMLWDDKDISPTVECDVALPLRSPAATLPTTVKLQAAHPAVDAMSVTYEQNVARRRARGDPESLVVRIRSYFAMDRASIETTYGLRALDCLVQLERVRAQSISQAAWSGEHSWYEEEQAKVRDLHLTMLKALRWRVFVEALDALGVDDIRDLAGALFPEASDSESQVAQERIRLKHSPSRQDTNEGTSKMDLLPLSQLIEKISQLTEQTLGAINSARSGELPPVAYHPTPPVPRPETHGGGKNLKKVSSFRSLFTKPDGSA